MHLDVTELLKVGNCLRFTFNHSPRPKTSLAYVDPVHGPVGPTDQNIRATHALQSARSWNHRFRQRALSTGNHLTVLHRLGHFLDLLIVRTGALRFRTRLCAHLNGLGGFWRNLSGLHTFGGRSL